MLQPKAAAGRIARAVGGDRATEVELRPLAAATHDSDDEGDDWGLPALPVPRRHRSGPCPALDPRYSRAVAGGWLFGCAFESYLHSQACQQQSRCQEGSCSTLSKSKRGAVGAASTPAAEE